MGQSVFSECYSLTNVSFGENSTFDSIKDNCFNYCMSLQSVNIPKSVTSIGGNAFYDCESLEVIYYDGTVEEFDAIAQDAGEGWHESVPDTAYVQCTDGVWNFPS